MAYGQTDDLIDERKGRQAAVNLLLEIAKGTKKKRDAQEFLEKHYPHLCVEKTERKKW